MRNPDVKMAPELNQKSSKHDSSDRDALFNNSRFSFDQEDSADSVKKISEALRKRQQKELRQLALSKKHQELKVLIFDYQTKNKMIKFRSAEERLNINNYFDINLSSIERSHSFYFSSLKGKSDPESYFEIMMDKGEV